MGATAHAIGAAMFETFAYDEEGNLLTPNFYDYHVPHTLDMPPLKTGAIESPSPFTPLGTKGMGEGGGGGIHCICAALQDALRAAGGAIVTDSHNPYHRVWEMLRHPRVAREGGGEIHVKLEGTKEFDAPREVVWSVINDPAKMAKTMPGVESFEIADDTHWSAKVKVPLGLGGLKMSIAFKKLEERPLEFASLNAKGQGVGALMNMTTSFTLSRRGRDDVDGVGGRRQDRRPRRLDGPARAAADRQPAGRERPPGARRGGAGGEGRRLGSDARFSELVRVAPACARRTRFSLRS